MPSPSLPRPAHPRCLSSLPLPLRRAGAALLLALSFFLVLPAGAPASPLRSADTAVSRAAAPAAPAPRLRSAAEGGGFPEPFWISLLSAVVGGAAGALAADLVAGGGRLRRWKMEEEGWELRALGKLIVGPVAAVVLLTLNPPGEAWWSLAATAALAGLGAEALLLAMVASRKALAAELGREAAEEGARRTVALAGEQLRTLRRIALDARGAAPAGSPLVAAEGSSHDEPGAAEPWERAVSAYAERAAAELERVSARYP